MKVYKLRNKVTGEYHRGGSEPLWGKQGKSYNSRDSLTTFINQWDKAHKTALKAKEEGASWNTDWYINYYPTPDMLEVVEFYITETECVVYQGTELVK